VKSAKVTSLFGLLANIALKTAPFGRSGAPFSSTLGVINYFRSAVASIWRLAVAYLPVALFQFERRYSEAIGCPKAGDCYVPGSEHLLSLDVIFFGSIPWQEQFDLAAPEPLEHEDPVYAKAVFHSLLHLWKGALRGALSRSVQRPKGAALTALLGDLQLIVMGLSHMR